MKKTHKMLKSIKVIEQIDQITKSQSKLFIDNRKTQSYKTHFELIINYMDN